MRATVTDVAKLAGVSISTVSRVLKNDYPVSDEARRKVLAAVKELNYTPHYIASSLKSKKANLLGVVIPRLTNTSVMRIAESIASEAKASNYMTLFACSENNVELEKNILNLFRSSLVDAIMVATVMDDAEVFYQLQEMNIPVILFDRKIGKGIDFVGEDVTQGAYTLTDYLIQKGHRRIMMLRGPEKLKTSELEIIGFHRAMKEAGLPVLPEMILPAEYKEQPAYDQVHAYLTGTDREKWPTAIFAGNGLMAKGALDAIQECGLHIPDDISIVSYGDLGLPKHMRPRLTCLSQSAEIGREIAKIALIRIRENEEKTPKSPTRTILIPTTFMDGDSVLDLNKRG